MAASDAVVLLEGEIIEYDLVSYPVQNVDSLVEITDISYEVDGSTTWIYFTRPLQTDSDVEISLTEPTNILWAFGSTAAFGAHDRNSRFHVVVNFGDCPVDEVTEAPEVADEPTPSVTVQPSAPPTPPVAETTPSIAEPTPSVAESTPSAAESTPSVAEPTPQPSTQTPPASGSENRNWCDWEVNDNYLLKWSITSDRTNVSFSIEVNTANLNHPDGTWVGWAVSANRQMVGADAVILESSFVNEYDLVAETRDAATAMDLDLMVEIYDKSSSYDGDVITLNFSRPLVTESDLGISLVSPTWFLWALGESVLQFHKQDEGSYMLNIGECPVFTTTQTEELTVAPTEAPTSSPTQRTARPSANPTSSPTEVPTESPTVSPTESPTESPTGSPTESPSEPPTELLTGSPTETPDQGGPSSTPTELETSRPTEPPTSRPTEPPTSAPTEPPTQVPTEPPTSSPTESPTNSPTEPPTSSPTESPTDSPTPQRSKNPTFPPTLNPTPNPTLSPRPSPRTRRPTDVPTAVSLITGSHELSSGFMMDWTVSSDQQSITFVLEVQETQKWIGFGFTETDSMLDADTVILDVDNNELVEYDLITAFGFSAEEVLLRDPAPEMSDASFGNDGTTTTITFTRPINPASGVPISLASTTQVIWAIGVGSTLEYHGGTRDIMEVTFGTPTKLKLLQDPEPQEPDAVEGGPDTADGEPDAADGEPDVVDGEPDAADGEPDAADGEPDVVEEVVEELAEEEEVVEELVEEEEEEVIDPNPGYVWRDLEQDVTVLEAGSTFTVYWHMGRPHESADYLREDDGPVPDDVVEQEVIEVEGEEAEFDGEEQAEPEPEAEAEANAVALEGLEGEPDGELSLNYTESFSIFLLDLETEEHYLLANTSGDQDLTEISVTLPSEILICDNCVIALKANTFEYVSTPFYYFKSCSNIKIVENTDTSCPADCNGNGDCNAQSECECYPGFDGEYCFDEVNCVDELTAANQMCLHDETYCTNGYSGPLCDQIPDVEFLTVHIDETQFSNYFISSDSAFEAYWTVNPTFGWIEMVMKAQTNGYVAVGWRPTSIGPYSHNMDYVDMVIGMVDEETGSVNVDDYWSISRSTPQRDTVYSSQGGTNDILDFAGMEKDGWTIIQFKKLLQTDDVGDYDIEDELYTFLYAFGQTAPYDPPLPQGAEEFYEPDVLLYHGSDAFLNAVGPNPGRGLTQVNFYELRVSDCSLLPSEGYGNVVKLQSDLIMHWRVDEENDQLHVRLVLDDVDKWIGFGLSSDGSMTSAGEGSDCVIAMPVESEPVEWNIRFQFEDPPGEEDEQQDLVDATIVESDGQMIVSFSRSFVTGDATDMDIDLINGNNVIFAVGSGAEFTLHESRDSDIIDWNAQFECGEEEEGQLVEEGEPLHIEEDSQCDTPDIRFGSEEMRFSHCVLDLELGFEVFWNVLIEDESLEILVRASNINDLEWIGFGFSTQPGLMVESTAVIACNGCEDPHLGDYYITSQTPDGVTEVNLQQLTSGPIQEMTDGLFGVYFVRPLDVGDDRVPVIDTTTDVHVIWATGPAVSEATTVTAHSVADRASASINFESGTTTATAVDPYLIAHGVTMTVGWGVFIPIGITAARFYQRPKGWWIKAHKGFNVSGVLLCITGFIIGVVQIGSHTSYAHMIIGIIVTFIGIFQGLNALVRPHKDRRTAPSSRRVIWALIHRWSGRFGVILAIANIAIGLVIGDVGVGLVSLTWVVIAIIAAWHFYKEMTTSFDKATNPPQTIQMQDLKHDSPRAGGPSVDLGAGTTAVVPTVTTTVVLPEEEEDGGEPHAPDRPDVY